MDWMNRMNAALQYIEEHLDGKIDLSRAAEKAACSSFYFQRMFLALHGVTPAEYARRRRLTLAATELTNESVKVIDVALKYGYDSPDSFARAFKTMHGITPSAAREPGVRLSAYPPISFYIETKGGKDMDYRIIDKPAFRVAMVSRQFTSVDGQNFKEIPVWWGEFLQSKDCGELTAVANNAPGAVTNGSMLGVCYGEAESGEFSYAISVEMPEEGDPGRFETRVIPSSTWAIFDCTLENLQNVTSRIWSEWYPATGYEHPGTPDLEVYRMEGPNSEMKVEIWAPVRKK